MAVTTQSESGLATAQLDNPSYQAYWILRVGFTVAPILFGLDKFFHVLFDWDKYLAGPVDDVIPGSGHTAMLVVGCVEIAAGLITALAPRIGGYLVAAWLLAIVANLLIKADHYDVALRDFGLALGALSLARLATGFRGLLGVPEQRGRHQPAGQGDYSPAARAKRAEAEWSKRMGHLHEGSSGGRSA